MIWENEEEMLEAILYWQKRALEAERELKWELDYQEFLLDQYTLMYDYAKELEESIDNSFSEYTKRILREERRGVIEVDGHR